MGDEGHGIQSLKISAEESTPCPWVFTIQALVSEPGPGVQARANAYRQLLYEPLSEDDLKAIRTHLQQQRALVAMASARWSKPRPNGSPAFAARIDRLTPVQTVVSEPDRVFAAPVESLPQGFRRLPRGGLSPWSAFSLPRAGLATATHSCLPVATQKKSDPCSKGARKLWSRHPMPRGRQPHPSPARQTRQQKSRA